jgi:two-component system NtrC family sensor kinase
MEKLKKGLYQFFIIYGVTVILAILAITVYIFGDGPKWAIPLAFIAFISFLTHRVLLHNLERAKEKGSILDERWLQSQRLASIGELSAGIAHEINNPLAIISQEAEWVQHLLKTVDLGNEKALEEIKDSIREIYSQVDRCKEITQNLLNFARKREPVIQMVNINKLVEDMARLAEKEASLANIKILRNYQDDLPIIYSDPPSLRQIVLNLLNNALYAIRTNGTIKIRTIRSGDNSIDLTIEDTGCGIPKENLGKIFDPFFTTKPQGKGTGLGLAICHGLIDKLDGSISVKSEVGKGTTFTVRLPIKREKG